MVIHNEVDSLSKSYREMGEQTNIAIGLRPSGIIHLGNMFTMGITGLLANKIGPHLTEMNVTVCDLDMPDKKDWSLKENGYMKYFGQLPDVGGCHRNLLEHSLEGIDNFMGGVSSFFGVKYNVQLLSTIQRDPSFRHGLKKVLSWKDFEKILPKYCRESGKLPIFPICPDCGTSSGMLSSYDAGILSNFCKNPSCDRDELVIDIEDTSVDLAVHYLIDPLRDKTVSPNSDIHVFGGDYRSGEFCGKSKIEKILDITRIATGGYVSDVLIGPTVYASDGTKMSKSKENGLTMQNLKSHFGDRYHKIVLETMVNIVEAGVKNIDYSLVNQGLFGS